MMPLTHNNNSFKDLTYQLYKHMSDKYEVLKNNKPKFIINTKQQSSHILGPTANYQPETKTITVYSFGRHPKDMLRSFAHEVIHHIQNCEGRLTNISTHEGYSLDDSNMIALEREAYEQGNMCFREFEDLYKRNTPINESEIIPVGTAGETIQDPKLQQKLSKNLKQVLMKVSSSVRSKLTALLSDDSVTSALKSADQRASIISAIAIAFGINDNEFAQIVSKIKTNLKATETGTKPGVGGEQRPVKSI
jgi:uncharacterized membrane-anchored protein YjiN (DUF445 family)